MRYRLLLIIILFTQAAIAETINVPDDFETIAEAIEESSDGDTVLIASGEYLIDTQINFGGKDIVVGSLFLTTGERHYIEETIIDAQGESRIFVLQNNETEEAQIVGLTLQNGRASYGGGIYCSNQSTPTLSYLVLTGNHATRYGGGIYSTREATPLITNVTITENSAEEGRGGLHFRDEAQPTVINSIIWNNDPPDVNDGSDITFSDIEGGYDGEGNIDDDPEFEDPEGRNFNLTEGSPCIDRADPDSPNDLDGTRGDIGALYFEQTPNIFIDPDILDFGEVNLGEIVDITLAIFSLGPLELEVFSIEIIDEDVPFVITEGGEAVILEAGDEHEISIRFTPEEVAEFNTVLIIDSDDPDDPTLEIPISGNGLPAIPNIEIDRNRIDFEDTALQRTTSEVVTIRNIGMAVLTVTNIRLEGNNPEVFSIEFNEEFVIEVDAAVGLEFNFSPEHLGEYACNLFIESDDRDEPEVEIRAFSTGVMPEQHFDPEWNNGGNHSLLVTEATLGDNPLADGSEIAVLSQDGLCCGSDFWMGEQLGFAAWGDNEMTEDVDGFVEDEQMIFVFWDAVSLREIDAEPELIRGEAVYHEDGLTVLELSAVGEVNPSSYTLRLARDWNMIAIPLIPDEDDIIEMWGPVVERENLLILKDQNGRFYLPEFGFNSIPFWDYHYGYQVKMIENDTLTIVGELIPEDLAIPLRDGWNIVNYFLPFDTDAIEAFENIVDVLEIAKDVEGLFYSPEYGFSNMGDLVRGNGYQAKVSEAIDLIWNFAERGAAIEPISRRQNRHFDIAVNTGRNMSLIITAHPFGGDETEIAAYTDRGILVGSASLEIDGQTGMAIWGDDLYSTALDGAIEGEKITFACYHAGEQFFFEPVWIKGSAEYHTDELAVMELKLDHSLPLEFTFGQIHPNPFNSSVQLEFSLPAESFAKLTAYDITGREVEVLMSQFRIAGNHTITWDARELVTGVYLLKLEADNHSITQKVTLLR